MNNTTQKLKHLIEKITLSSEKVFEDFTPEQDKIVESESKYYYALIELKKVRKKMGLTQEQLADMANLPRTTISKIESGNYNPTINTLMSIASAMNGKLQINLEFTPT